MATKRTGAPSSRDHGPNRARRFDSSGDWIARLSGKVTVSGECWIFRGRPNEYPTIWIGGKQEGLHRAVYAEINGPIPDGMQIHHTCITPGCINPQHLVALTPAEHGLAHRRAG